MPSTSVKAIPSRLNLYLVILFKFFLKEVYYLPGPFCIVSHSSANYPPIPRDNNPCQLRLARGGGGRGYGGWMSYEILRAKRKFKTRSKNSYNKNYQQVIKKWNKDKLSNNRWSKVRKEAKLTIIFDLKRTFSFESKILWNIVLVMILIFNLFYLFRFCFQNRIFGWSPYFKVC